MTALVKGAHIGGPARIDAASTIAARYHAGASIRAIAADLGRSYSWVRNVLVESGVDLRARGGYKPGVS